MPRLRQLSMEIVRGGVSFRDRQGKNAVSFHRNDIVQILEHTFDHDEFLADQEQTIFLKHVGSDDGVGYTSLIFHAEKDKTFCGSRPLTHNHTARNSHPL